MRLSLTRPPTIAFRNNDEQGAEKFLRRAGTAFLKALVWADSCDRKDGECIAGRDTWTDFVLDWWEGTAGTRNLVVDTSPRVKSDWRSVWRQRPKAKPIVRPGGTEFLVDMLISDYPQYQNDFYRDGYWKRVFKRSPRTPYSFKLALESEWGSQKSRQANRTSVLEDALKLVHVRAETKVIIFSATYAKESKPGGPPKALFQDILKLRQLGGDTSPWLAVCAPWNLEAQDAAWKPLAWVVTEKEPEGTPLSG